MESADLFYKWMLVFVSITTFTYVESLTCGQTVCSEKEYCCKDRPDCCCYESPSGFSYHCASHSSESTGLRWYEVLTIVLVVGGICAGIAAGVICYRRRRQNTYGSI